MTHSPGPWAAYDNAAYGTAIKSNQTNKYVANVHMYAGLSVETYQANARLIAAAPELLTALRVALDALRPSASNARRNEVRAATRAVIAKATRGQP